jgi:hypothetical protein
MASKKNDKGSSSGSLPALKIGSRVRCTDDRVEGRIVWANAVSVKIQWDDGEQVTWRRDSLAGRPIEILDSTGAEEQVDVSMAQAAVAESGSTESPPTETSLVPPSPEAATIDRMQSATEAAVSVIEPATAGPVPPVPTQGEAQAAPASADTTVESPVPSKRRRKASATPKEKKLSALDAAAKVLGETGQPMNCQQMIAVMAAKGYWTSPGGKTPAATLYSAVLREITAKGTARRFVKAERGKFARTSAI